MMDKLVSKRIAVSESREFGFVEQRLMEILAKVEDRDGSSMQAAQTTEYMDNYGTPKMAIPPCGF